jgi:hypothetical protein
MRTRGRNKLHEMRKHPRDEHGNIQTMQLDNLHSKEVVIKHSRNPKETASRRMPIN